MPPPTTPVRLTLGQARRVALAAQGLHRPRQVRPGGAGARQVTAVLDRLGLLQIDSVNVLARAHLMPVFSRLGPYDPAVLDRASGRAPRRLVEYWAHEASFVPPETYRLLHFRQQRHATEAWGSIRSVGHEHPEVVREVRDLVAARGPLTAAQVQQLLDVEHVRDSERWGWQWSVTKRALELLFFTGEVTSAGRTQQFERRYDLTERVLPPGVLAVPPLPEEEAVHALVAIAARAHGIASMRCLGDYFRLTGPPVRAAVERLVDDGTLLPAVVPGWDRPLFLHAEARVPRRATGAALLSPFDPVVFERRRLLELFGMHYRIEIYVPAPRRTYGYYVLPFLLGETFAARVDLKADRGTGRLLVRGAFAEEDAPPRTSGELARELWLLADWLGMAGVVVEADARGDLVADLTRELLAGAPQPATA